MRQRIRPPMQPAELERLYNSFVVGTLEEKAGYVKTYPDTRTFYNAALALGRGFPEVKSIADMSCGSSYIPFVLGQEYGVEPLLGDLIPGYQYQGTLQETVPQLPLVDLFICTETIEHVEDPDADLRLIRVHARNLLLTTPLDEPPDYSEGHLWRWDREGVEEILAGADFKIQAYIELDMTMGWSPHCRFGVWACSEQ